MTIRSLWQIEVAINNYARKWINKINKNEKVKRREKKGKKTNNKEKSEKWKNK